MTKIFLEVANNVAMFLNNRSKDISTFIVNSGDRLYLNLANNNKQVHNRVLSIRTNPKNGCHYVTLMLKSGDVVEIEKMVNGVTAGSPTSVIERWLFKDGKVTSLPMPLDKQKPVLVKLTRSRAHTGNMHFLTELGILDHLVTKFRRYSPITVTINTKPNKFNLNTLDNYIAYSANYRDGKYHDFTPITPSNYKTLNLETTDAIFAIPVDFTDQRVIICYTDDSEKLTNLISSAESFLSWCGNGANTWTILPKFTVDEFDDYS